MPWLIPLIAGVAGGVYISKGKTENTNNGVVVTDSTVWLVAAAGIGLWLYGRGRG